MTERSRRSWKKLFSIPYSNQELKVVLQVVKGYRDSKWSIIHFIWENVYDTKVCIDVTGNMGAQVGIRSGWAALHLLRLIHIKNYQIFDCGHRLFREGYQFSRASTMKTENICQLLEDIDLMILIWWYWFDDLSNSVLLFYFGTKFPRPQLFGK